MSVRQKSYVFSASLRRASARSSAGSTSTPIRVSVSSSSSRRSGSSSTMSALDSAIRFPGNSKNVPCPILLQIGQLCRLTQRRIGPAAPEQYPETGARIGNLYVFQRRLVRIAELPREEQAQAGTLLVGGKERFENLTALFQRNAGAVVDDVQGHLAVAADRAQAQRDRRLVAVAGGVSHGVVHQVVHGLSQLAGIHQNLDSAARRLDPDPGVRQLVFDAEFFGQRAQPVGDVGLLDLGPLAAREFQHVLDDVVHPTGVVADDLYEAQVLGGEIGRLAEQLRGVAQGAQRVADFMRDGR